MKLGRKYSKVEKVRAPLARVSKSHPCPICGKPDWCNYAIDGSIALCMRESAGSVKQADNNAYIHVLTPNFNNVSSAISTSPIDDCGNCGNGSADEDQRNAVYSYLLGDCLILKPEHGEQLLSERGLGDKAIAAKLYASIPSHNEWERVCQDMQKRFGDDLAGVPGFFKEDGRWKMPRYEGFFIPVRDAQCRIVALQIRGSFDSRYLWFSTPPEKYPHGTSSGTPIHFVKPDLVKQQGGHALITEGALKGDIISEYEDEAVIALASATAFNSAEIGAELKRALPELLKVSIAYDADWRENPAVKNALRRLVRALRAAEFDVNVRIWNISLGKGYDDALLAVERAAEHVK